MNLPPFGIKLFIYLSDLPHNDVLLIRDVVVSDLLEEEAAVESVPGRLWERTRGTDQTHPPLPAGEWQVAGSSLRKEGVASLNYSR